MNKIKLTKNQATAIQQEMEEINGRDALAAEQIKRHEEAIAAIRDGLSVAIRMHQRHLNSLLLDGGIEPKTGDQWGLWSEDGEVYLKVQEAKA